ncbi:MAG: hypothetical protein ACR2F8_07270, partial [Caulobacteraceae bacterium]
MTTKHITGTYAAGYTLSATYSAVRIAASGEIDGAGLSVSNAEVFNHGRVTAGDYGATGVDFAGAGRLTNAHGATIAGGVGIVGAYGRDDSGGTGGGGGSGVTPQGGGIVNRGAIAGGAGGVGGEGYYAGT